MMMDRAQIEYLPSVFVSHHFWIFATAFSHPAAQIITIKK
jgi:hypothetical protein